MTITYGDVSLPDGARELLLDGTQNALLVVVVLLVGVEYGLQLVEAPSGQHHVERLLVRAQLRLSRLVQFLEQRNMIELRLNKT